MVMAWILRAPCCGNFQARLIGRPDKVTAALAPFERLKKDAAFAPKLRPSSWRVSSYIKASRDLKNLSHSQLRDSRGPSRSDFPEVAINHILKGTLHRPMRHPRLLAFVLSNQHLAPSLLVRRVRTRFQPSRYPIRPCLIRSDKPAQVHQPVLTPLRLAE